MTTILSFVVVGLAVLTVGTDTTARELSANHPVIAPIDAELDGDPASDWRQSSEELSQSSRTQTTVSLAAAKAPAKARVVRSKPHAGRKSPRP
jgi:hypothetical protein